MFEGFTDETLDVPDASIRVRYGGSGPAVVLLHGHPRTAATWHRVAPRLVDAGFRVICPDLRGYGASTGPLPDPPEYAAYSKRAMAADVVAVADRLGIDRFHLAGHDRGSYVASRLVRDAPTRVVSVALLDSVPILEALERCDERFARLWWHWFFFAQPDAPERAILADPDAWYGGDPESMGDEAYAEYRRAIHDPDVVAAMLADYRAGLGIDRRHDEQDRAAGRRIEVPTLLLWSTHDDMELLYGDPLAVWRSWANDVYGFGIESGHHVAEEAPGVLAAALAEFFGTHR